MENVRKPISERMPIKININNATYQQLVRLPGIGDVIAAKIILHRKNNGAFTNLEELPRAVDRSEVWLDQIRHRLEV